MIYVSTGGCTEQTAFKTATELSKVGIKSYEMSGGLYDPDNRANLQLLANDASVQLHNYFPPPKKTFCN